MNKKRVRVSMILGVACLLIGIAYACELINITCDPCDSNIVSLKYYEADPEYVSTFESSAQSWISGQPGVPAIETWEWSSTGGTIDPGGNWPEQNLRFDSAGFYDVNAIGTMVDGAWGLGVCEDFLVFDTQLDVNGVPDDDEEDPGVFIAYNDDDDNENGVPDYLDDGDASEDDLVKIDLIDCLPDDLTFGFLELRVSKYAGFRVWGSEHKGDGNLLIDSGGSKRWGVDSAPTELWIEGTAMVNGQLELWYTPDGSWFPGTLKVDSSVLLFVHEVIEFSQGVAAELSNPLAG